MVPLLISYLFIIPITVNYDLPTGRMIKEDYNFIASLLPFRNTVMIYMMPPMHPIIWLQYLTIICAADKLDQSSHKVVEQEMTHFLEWCNILRDHELEYTRRSLLPPLVHHILIFYCIRTYCMVCNKKFN